MTFLFDLFKCLALILGIMVIIVVMLAIITAPFKTIKQNQEKAEFEAILDEIIKNEIEKSKKEAKKTNKNKED